jgi:hypothetical protein
MTSFGYTQQQKVQMRTFTNQQKWTILSQTKPLANANRMSPEEFLANLKKLDQRVIVSLILI